MEIHYIPIETINKKICHFENDISEIGMEKLKYYKILLEYRREEERTDLRNLIKRKLNINEIGGSYEISDISKVLEIPKSEVKHIENKIVRLLKSPTKSKKLKIYLNGG